MPLPASYCRQLETPCGPHRAVFICRSFAYTVHLFLSAPYTGGISSPFLVCFAGYSICIFTLTSVRHPARPSCGALLREPLSYSPWVVARSRESHYQTRSRPLCALLLPSSFERQIRIRWQASLRFALFSFAAERVLRWVPLPNPWPCSASLRTTAWSAPSTPKAWAKGLRYSRLAQLLSQET